MASLQRTSLTDTCHCYRSLRCHADIRMRLPLRERSCPRQRDEESAAPSQLLPSCRACNEWLQRPDLGTEKLWTDSAFLHLIPEFESPPQPDLSTDDRAPLLIFLQDLGTPYDRLRRQRTRTKHPEELFQSAAGNRTACNGSEVRLHGA